MQRRTFVALLASAVSGCQSRDPGSADRTVTPAPVPDGSEAIISNVGQSIPFDPIPPSRVSCQDSPPETVCYGDAADTKIWLAPERTTVRAGSPLRFALANGRQEPFRYRVNGWNLSKRVGDRWSRVPISEKGARISDIEPGGADIWSLTCSRGPETAKSRVDMRLDVTGVGGGKYALTVGGRSATFRVEAPPLKVAPKSVVDVRLDGDTVLGRVPTTDDRSVGRVTVTPVDDDSDAPPITAETLRGWPVVHDALALLRSRDVDTAQIVGPTHHPPAVVDTLRYRFRGTPYRVNFEAIER